MWLSCEGWDVKYFLWIQGSFLMKSLLLLQCILWMWHLARLVLVGLNIFIYTQSGSSLHKLLPDCVWINMDLVVMRINSSIIHLRVLYPKILRMLLLEPDESFILFVLIYWAITAEYHSCTNKYYSGLILGLCPANERLHYFVTATLIHWVQA